MDSLAKPKNRALFLMSVAVTGAFAGAAVWLFFFAMEHGIDYLWTEIPHMLGVGVARARERPVRLFAVPVFCLPAGRPADRSVRKAYGHQDRWPQPGDG